MGTENKKSFFKILNIVNALILLSPYMSLAQRKVLTSSSIKHKHKLKADEYQGPCKREETKMTGCFGNADDSSELRNAS
jgi:hypothetical protein